MKKLITVLLFIFVNLNAVQSQIVTKEIPADKYKIILTWNDSVFYSGGMVVKNESGDNVFSADNFHSGYNSDKSVDLNNDGNSEFLLELETGNTRSDYNMYVIFDFSMGPDPKCEVHNAELISKVDKVNDIVSNVRVGDPKMEAKYSYALTYDKGKLMLNKDIKSSKVLQELVPFAEDYSDLINEYAKTGNVCDESSQVKNYYLAYIIQQKIVTNEDEGLKFFETNYKCENKKDLEAELKSSVNEHYSKISNPDNFNFKTNN
ncbi:MAG TPA: hypothetical protein PKD83_03240 [Ignavibacteria bacterium]|nr:hypothetical protein [Ignavibacteria bacterium]